MGNNKKKNIMSTAGTATWTGILYGGSSTAFNTYIGVAKATKTTADDSIAVYTFAPTGYVTCVTFGADTTIDAEIDIACVKTIAAVMTLVGDYYGVTSGAPTVDVSPTVDWIVSLGTDMATIKAWDGAQAALERLLASAETGTAYDFGMALGTAFKVGATIVAGAVAPTSWTTNVITCDVTANTASTVSCTGWTASGAMSMVAPFAAVAYAVAALF